MSCQVVGIWHWVGLERCMLNDTAPMPLARSATAAVGRPLRRLEALSALGACGERYTWRHFDLLVTLGGLWIAQDDWLPELGEADPIPAEWRGVLTLCRELGYHDLGEPMYDSSTGTWIWSVLS
jgi:hypothetical protein